MRVMIILIGLMACACMAHAEYSAKFINAMRKGAETSIEIHICDDDGAPVSNATVHVCYNVGKGRSEVFGNIFRGDRPRHPSFLTNWAAKRKLVRLQ